MTELNPIRLDLNVPTVATRDQQIAPGWQYPPIPPGSYSEQELEDPGVPLSHYLWALRRHRYKIVAFVIMCVCGTYIVSSRLTPIYEATTTIDASGDTPSHVVRIDIAGVRG